MDDTSENITAPLPDLSRALLMGAAGGILFGATLAVVGAGAVGGVLAVVALGYATAEGVSDGASRDHTSWLAGPMRVMAATALLAVCAWAAGASTRPFTILSALAIVAVHGIAASQHPQVRARTRPGAARSTWHLIPVAGRHDPQLTHTAAVDVHDAWSRRLLTLCHARWTAGTPILCGDYPSTSDEAGVGVCMDCVDEIPATVTTVIIGGVQITLTDPGVARVVLADAIGEHLPAGYGPPSPRVP